MNKTKKMLIGVTVLAIIAYAVNVYAKKAINIQSDLPQEGKQGYIDTIIKSGNATNVEVLQKFDKEYLERWNDAILNNKLTFIHNQNLYRVRGGTKV
jgi:hypothetical protein